LPDSELTNFNHDAGSKVKISPAFKQLLERAFEMSRVTDGLYNPFILPSLQRAGYLATWDKHADSPDPINFTDRKSSQIDALEIGPAWARIPSDTALDFGGIGKGYLLDHLSALIDVQNVPGYCFSLGGDIICRGVDLDGAPWHIAVEKAGAPGVNLDGFTNDGGGKLAVATSGTTKRRGTKDGVSWHHIIDPHTGRPARTQVLTATVSATDAVSADVFAKTIVITGASFAETLKRDGHIRDAYVQQSDTPHDALANERIR
jgi:thiamine biosynthesis lipoprotein